MITSETTKKSAVLFFLVIFTMVSLSGLFAQDYQKSKQTKKHVNTELMMANINMGLHSDNPGVRMSAVELVGRYNISNFEDCLVEMLEDEKCIEDKEMIVFSLFKLGSFKSINTIKNLEMNCENKELKDFCSKLLKEYKEYEKVRKEYFNQLVVSLNEN